MKFYMHLLAFLIHFDFHKKLGHDIHYTMYATQCSFVCFNLHVKALNKVCVHVPCLDLKGVTMFGKPHLSERNK